MYIVLIRNVFWYNMWIITEYNYWVLFPWLCNVVPVLPVSVATARPASSTLWRSPVGESTVHVRYSCCGYVKVTRISCVYMKCTMMRFVTLTNWLDTVFDLISEHTLISEHPPILCWWRRLPEHIEIYVYWLCYCVASCNRYLMLINHPTDGATRGLTLRVCLLGRNKKKKMYNFY